MNRVSSGVQGFDELVNGGIPRHDVVLLSGVAGSGKTAFGLRFATEEPGIYISFEDEIDQLHEAADSFGIGTKKLIEENRLRILKYDPFRLEDILEIVESSIREISAKRVVIDSISALGIYMRDPTDLRRTILQMNAVLRRNSCTGLLISEILPHKPALSRFGMEEFVADGVIIMQNFLISGTYKRGLSVWKMRLTDHSKAVHEYEITSKGIAISEKIIRKDVF